MESPNQIALRWSTKCTFKQYQEQVSKIEKNILLKIWEILFNDPAPNPKGFSPNSRRILEDLTDKILTHYRYHMPIDSRFIGKCIQHKLDKITIFILDHQSSYQMKLNENMTDLVIFLSIEYEHIDLFILLIQKVTLIHIQYALKHGSISFLSKMASLTNNIPDFKAHVQAVEKNEQNTWKEQKFLQWIKN